MKITKGKEDLICSIGTLDSGNHCFKINRDEDCNVWFATHKGARNVNFQVRIRYQG